ncbi:hypothetical protein D1007_30397 [Hordeum vulgare]|nr:hypothetical protein D1007_30397 [Hordeum vulgare]
MDPSEILNVRFHFGGEFIRTGAVLDYVGGDESFSEIERDKLSLFEVLGHLKDHLEYKESMKLYFHLPGKELADGLRFLFDDSGCVSVSDYICVGDVADIYVEYHGEQDSVYSSSASDYENELVDEYMDDGEGEQPDMVISAEPDDNGVLTQMNNIHYEQPDDVAGSQFICSQICSPDEGNVHSNTEAVHDHSNLRSETDNVQSKVRTIAVNDESNNAVSASDSEEDTEYIAHNEDSGENSEVVELRRHARKFKKRMRDTKSWIAGNYNYSTCYCPRKSCSTSKSYSTCYCTSKIYSTYYCTSKSFCI